MSSPEPLYRSYLYAPGSSARILGKVLDAGADAVVLDLEDAVAPDDKAGARRAVAALIAERGVAASCAVHVRINRGPHGYDAEDVRAVCQPGLEALRLPKAVEAAEIAALEDLLAECERAAEMPEGSVALYPTVESAAGALAADALAGASPRVARLAFGATDFLADINATGGPDGPATLMARSHLVLASRAAGIGAPVDSVHTAVDDLDGLTASARAARELGFFGKSVIHPRQIAPVHAVFTPSEEEVAAARRVVEAFGTGERAALTVDGEFVDVAVVARARALLTLAERAS